jgi:restriction endonuclease S subunit
MSNDHQSKLLEEQRACNAKIDALRTESKRKEAEWRDETEALRQTKDAKIRQTEREKEDQRHQYEVKVNDLDSKIKSKCAVFSDKVFINK